ncbi:MAG TPA: AAA family ATPase [Saprospiraceae bacterium]|nr:AAA family ATPase [Saprospiraceae bacterium]
MKEPLVLDHTFQDILNELENNQHHYFITGKAGTGKSTLLQLFRKTTQKKVVVLSSTGISALNVQGQTIHSFFQFPPKLLVAKELHIIRRLENLLKAVEVIIIDEISMVRADVMDAIDMSLRMHRKNMEPFGGVQMILFGDLFQLPPVVSSQEEKQYFSTIYPNPYFFSANVFQSKATLEKIELTKVYRQNERHFIRLLDAIRTLQFDYDDLDSLNERYLPDEPIEEPYLTLCSINALANQINVQRLSGIDEPSVFFEADVKGDFNPKLYPTDYRLELKKHAQVILVRNDPEKRFVNGSLATIVDLNQDNIVVQFKLEDGNTKNLDLPKMTWELQRYKYSEDQGNPIQSEVTGTFTQYPIRLAWAVTIHKSQGKTYDRVAIDLGRGAFEHGQTYVALSRCKRLDGVFLKKPLTPRDIMVDEQVVQFYASMR